MDTDRRESPHTGHPVTPKKMKLLIDEGEGLTVEFKLQAFAVFVIFVVKRIADVW